MLVTAFFLAGAFFLVTLLGFAFTLAAFVVLLWAFFLVAALRGRLAAFVVVLLFLLTLALLFALLLAELRLVAFAFLVVFALLLDFRTGLIGTPAGTRETLRLPAAGAIAKGAILAREVNTME